MKMATKIIGKRKDSIIENEDPEGIGTCVNSIYIYYSIYLTNSGFIIYCKYFICSTC